MTHEERRRLIEAPLCIRTIGSNARGAATRTTINVIADQQMYTHSSGAFFTPADMELFMYEADETDLARWQREAEKRDQAEARRADILRVRQEKVQARQRAAQAARTRGRG